MLRVLDILLLRKLKVRLTLYFSDSTLDGMMYLSHSSSSILFRSQKNSQSAPCCLNVSHYSLPASSNSKHAQAFISALFSKSSFKTLRKVGATTLESCWNITMSRQSSETPGLQAITLNNMLGMLGSHYALEWILLIV